jgi:serine/threonine protein kinase/Tfp pilus assembly protein PilF
MIGRTISHYRIVEKLGEGGMGVVYIAEDTVLGRRVAIKTLTARGGDNQHFRTRFLREARAVSALSHPHIAHIYDYGETEDDEPYIVMELIKGTTLGDLMAKEALTIPRAIEIVKQVAEALGEAHRNGIVHRDIKPSNVAINDRGNVKVLDFGLAKQLELGGVNLSDPERQTLLNTQTREGVIVGTPMYLSPEQALGVDVDARSDLFALGGLLYECIAGKPAFSGGSPVEICAQIIREDPPPPSQLNSNVSREMDRIALKALAKKPEERYQSADEMIADLRAVEESVSRGSDRTVTRLISSTPGTQPTGAIATLSDIFKRPRLSIGYVAAAIMLLGVIAFIALRLTRGAPYQPPVQAHRSYEKGTAALREGTYFTASKHFEKALAVDPNYALAHARLAEAYSALDYTDKAKDHMMTASRLVSRSLLAPADALYFDAISATMTRDLTGAIKAYEEIARTDSSNADVVLDLARAYESNYETDKAIATYERAAQLNAGNPSAPLRLGALYGRKQDLARSTGAFDRADAFFNDSQNFEGRAEVAYQRGFLLEQMSKIPEARTQAQNSLDIAKIADNKYQQVRALLLLGSVASSGDTAIAQEFVSAAIDLARSNEMENLVTQGLLDLGQASLLRRAFDQVERYVRQGLDLAERYKQKQSSARAQLLLGSSYIQQEEADKGKSFIDQALSFYAAGGYRREVSRCRVMIGRYQLLKGDFQGALKTLDETLLLAKEVEDPGEMARSHAEVASALSKQDFYPQAERHYNESYQLYKALAHPLRTAYAILNRGDMLTRLGRYEEAQAAMTELQIYLDLLSDDSSYKQIYGAWSHLYLARMYLSQRKLPEARSECVKALAIAKPDDNATQAEIKATQGLIEVHGGASARGRALCEAAAALITNAPLQHKGSVLLALAEAQLESGDAKAALETALKAQQILATLHEPEREWRAWLLAALASRNLPSEAGHALSRANQLLAELRGMWDPTSFSWYAERADIHKYLEQIKSLTIHLD